MSGRNPGDRELAVECLRLANRHGEPIDQAVKRATAYFAFATNQPVTDLQHIADVLRSALEAIDVS